MRPQGSGSSVLRSTVRYQLRWDHPHRALYRKGPGSPLEGKVTVLDKVVVLVVV